MKTHTYFAWQVFLEDQFETWNLILSSYYKININIRKQEKRILEYIYILFLLGFVIILW